jgi:UDP-2,4-diacetamido-2,4,6-trideoxy-beta-L-altropyranose hydrolase
MGLRSKSSKLAGCLLAQAPELNASSFRVAFRVDAGMEMGLGHVMRCLALADALHAKGASITFVSGRVPKGVQSMIAERGYDLHLLSAASLADNGDSLAHSHWLGRSQLSDAEETVSALSGTPCDWLIVDHYALDAKWEALSRAVANRVMAIDDLADRHHDADVLLDQNCYRGLETRYNGRVRDECVLLLGPTYALLRPEFARLRDATPSRDGVVRRILVLLGGVDPSNVTETVVRAIASLGPAAPAVDVVIGGEHPARVRIQALCAEFRFGYYVQTNEIARLMAAADLAVGATGATSWERCCLGLPTIGMTLAANQAPIAEALAMRGAILNLGDAAALSVNDIAAAIERLLGDPRRVAAMSTAAREVVDGSGAERVCHHLLAA